MTTEDFNRRLTAIFSADVKGYSRLMAEDEEAIVRTLTAYRKAERESKIRSRIWSTQCAVLGAVTNT